MFSNAGLDVLNWNLLVDDTNKQINNGLVTSYEYAIDTQSDCKYVRPWKAGASQAL